MIVEREVTFAGTCQAALVGEVLTVSHRWMQAHEPDPEGLQLAAIKAHLKAHEGIQLVWFDAWCLPQGNQRTDEEIADFKRMLTEVNLLYLGTSVLILLDLSYLSRFWTQFEAWLAMQQVTADGLRSADASMRRYTVVTTYNANEAMSKGLVDMWANRTPAEAIEVLSKDDVTVTNLSDKHQQLGKLSSLDSRVRAQMSS